MQCMYVTLHVNEYISIQITSELIISLLQRSTRGGATEHVHNIPLSRFTSRARGVYITMFSFFTRLDRQHYCHHYYSYVRLVE